MFGSHLKQVDSKFTLFVVFILFVNEIIKWMISILYQNIMKDRWINIGYEEKELKPYKEPPKDLIDPKRIGKCDTRELQKTIQKRSLLSLHFIYTLHSIKN